MENIKELERKEAEIFQNFKDLAKLKHFIMENKEDYINAIKKNYTLGYMFNEKTKDDDHYEDINVILNKNFHVLVDKKNTDKVLSGFYIEIEFLLKDLLKIREEKTKI